MTAQTAPAASAKGVRITDLANPVLTDMQKGAIAAAAAAPLHLSVDDVLRTAEKAASLSDFGPDDFRERLAVWIQSIEEDEGLSALGRNNLFNDCVNHAANRLRIEDLVKRNPEILDIAIDRPIIVAGLPRSGTTHLLNLLSSDPRLRSMPLWESMQPIPGPNDRVGPGAVDPRLVRAQAGWEMFNALLPDLKAMHEMSPEHVHEEIELQGPDFSNYIIEWLSRPQRWRNYYYAHDQTPHYRYMKKVLQVLTWFRGPNRWVLKSPQHMEQLIPLITTFPDATIVITHRDPVAVIQSAITMITYGDRIRRTVIDPEGTANYWIGRVEHLLRAAVRDRDALPAKQTIDVLFHEFMADDLGTIAQIYDMAGLPLTDEALARFRAFIAAHPRGKHAQIVYDLKGDFKQDPAAIRKRFDFYTKRFPVRTEI